MTNNAVTLMNASSVALILAKVQSFDRRTVGEADVLAWREALEDVDYDEALHAVTEHFKTSDAWLMPARIREIVFAQRRRDAEQTKADAIDQRMIEARKDSALPSSEVKALFADAIERGNAYGESLKPKADPD